MKNTIGIFGTIGASLIMALTFIPSAHAIKCNGPYQVIKGQGEIATPYCQDNYLAKVAREYGRYVTNREIRQNPNKKEEICHHIGHDSRVAEICSNLIDFGGRERR